jgi:branched-chain amino acid transport system substrate-binding protein
MHRIIGPIMLSWLSAVVSVPAFAQVRIALAGPMTGANASFGDQLRAGAEAAVAQINSQGGVRGEKLELIVADDACDPRQAVSVANKLAGDGVRFIAGHFCSGSTLPASEVYAEAGAIVITVSTNPKITERGMKALFRIGGRDDQQGPTAADFIVKSFVGRRIAIVHDKSSFGAGLAGEVRSRLVAERQQIVFDTGINAGEKDHSALISRLKAARVDVLFFGGYHTEAGLIMRQAADQGLRLEMIGGDPLASSEFVAVAGDAANGVHFTFAPDPRKNPASSDAVRAMRARQVEPEGWALYSYATIQIFAEAMVKANSTESRAVAQAVAGSRFATAVGEVRFDAKGDNLQPGFVVYRWQGGKSDYAEGMGRQGN